MRRMKVSSLYETMDLTQLPKNLPAPDADMLAHSQQLTVHIRQCMAQAGGEIPFEQFMHLALYAPGLGYYSAGARKFGESGDFITAPEISSVFSQCLASNCKAVLDGLGGGCILEIGAGSGAMARDILLSLEEQNSLPDQYFILEVSADLRARQRDLIEVTAPHLLDRVDWLDSLPVSGFQGIVLGNEVVDAMPVHLFRMEDAQTVSEAYVTWQGDGFAYRYHPKNEGPLFDYVMALKQSLPEDTLYSGYVSEVNLQSRAWMQSLANMLERGAVLLLDYGFPQQEFYHHDRSMGTLMCHYRHHSHDNPLILPGLQDITAHVDFSALAAFGHNAGLNLAGYTTQSHFLLASGLDAVVATSDMSDMRRHMELVQQVKKLVMPNEMGELFKAIAWVKQYDGILPGFAQHDLSERL